MSEAVAAKLAAMQDVMSYWQLCATFLSVALICIIMYLFKPQDDDIVLSSFIPAPTLDMRPLKHKFTFVLSLPDLTQPTPMPLKVGCNSTGIYWRLFWNVNVAKLHSLVNGPISAIKRTIESPEDTLSSSYSKLFYTGEEIFSSLPRCATLHSDSGEPRKFYPAILLAAISDIQEVSDEMVASVQVLHFRDEATQNLTSRVLYWMLKHRDGRVSHMQSMYRADRECVICLTATAVAVLLPCKHASCCSACLQRLPPFCPVCRTAITAYFLTTDGREEVVSDADAHAKSE